MLPCMSFCFVLCLSLLHAGVSRSKLIFFEINSDALVTTLILLLCFVFFRNTGDRGKHKKPARPKRQDMCRRNGWSGFTYFENGAYFRAQERGVGWSCRLRSRCFFRCSMKTMQILAYLHNFLSFSSPQNLIKTKVSNLRTCSMESFGGLDLPRIGRPCWNTRSRKGLKRNSLGSG